MTPNAETELARLCEACGLCCDASLFGRVDLELEEVESARQHRLPIVRERRAFEQPCSALVTVASGGCCAIYEDRPRACRRFECRLHARHRREGGPVEPRIAVVERVRYLVATLEQTGLTPADFDAAQANDAPLDPRIAAARPLYLELTRTLESEFSREG
jgi:Fe-S-cluster containining protein